MPKVNVYLPDDLAAAVKDARLPVSTICQVALREALSRIHPAPTPTISESLKNALGGWLPELPLSPHIEAVLSLAPDAAARRGSPEVETADVLQAILDQQESLILRGLSSLGLTVERIQSALDAAVTHGTPISRQRVRYSRGAVEVVIDAANEAYAYRENVVHGAHLVWALANSPSGRSATILRGLGFFDADTRDALRLLSIGADYAQKWSPTADPGYRRELSVLAKRLDRIETALQEQVSLPQRHSYS
ncbi:MAG: Clp protease N-terminal domain-containing protein [Gordonia sp. (in: high G+C Gram-positive bacteria)]